MALGVVLGIKAANGAVTGIRTLNRLAGLLGYRVKNGLCTLLGRDDQEQGDLGSGIWRHGPKPLEAAYHMQRRSGSGSTLRLPSRAEGNQKPQEFRVPLPSSETQLSLMQLTLVSMILSRA